MLETGRVSLLDAEGHTVHDLSSAYYRYRLVNAPYDASHLTDSESFPSREIGATVAEQCGSGAEFRMEIYDQWADILRNQADYAVLAQNPRCSRLALASTPYDIARSYDDLSKLSSVVGRRDPDILHLRALLAHWARTQGTELPPLTARDRIVRLESFESTRYAAVEAALKSAC
jgi:hypothetical protein